jgi:hypothetical protein
LSHVDHFGEKAAQE